MRRGNKASKRASSARVLPIALHRPTPRGRRIALACLACTGRHIFWPSLLWVQVGLREPDRIVRDLSVLERKGIEVIKAEVTRIDPETKVVEASGEELRADYLVISLGAQLAPELAG